MRIPQRGRGGGGLMRLLPIVLFGLYFVYYWFAHRSEVPLTGRKQLVDISQEQEKALGLQAYQEILAQEQVLPASSRETRMVREIAVRLIKAVRAIDPKADPGFDWDANVIRSDQANAFALPGGKIAVYTGILPVTQNIDGLAAVMGHEIAHAIARHGAERMAYQKLVQVGSMAAGVAIGDMDPGTQRMVMGALGAGANFGVLLPFSREHESEADHMGLLFAAAACFDPTEAPKLWVRMGEASGGRGQQPEFASTHPNHETRIRQLEEWMPEALEVRSKFCSGAGQVEREG